LITGASGALGQQLIYEMTRRGCRPIAHVRESSDTAYIDSLGLEKRVADLRNKEQLAGLVDGIDGIIHTAAWVDFRQDRLTQFTGINTFGAVELYKAARKAGVERFLHVSTVAATAAIPHTNGSPSLFRESPERVTEETEYNLSHLRIPYFMTKRAAEVELKQLAEDGGPELVTVNPSIILSPSPAGNDRARAIKRFGYWVLPGFQNRVNFVDIRDVAPGIISALRLGRPGERYILAGDNVTARELVLTASAIVHRIPHVMAMPRRPFELAAKFSLIWGKLTGKSRIGFYPDLVRLLDFDWAYSSMKARQELGYTNRSIWVTLDDILNEHCNGTWLRPAPAEKKKAEA